MSFFQKAAKKSCPIHLPAIPESHITASYVEDLLAAGTPVYAWYSADKLGPSAIESFTGRNLEGLFMVRKELDFLATYVAYFIEGVIVFRLYEVAMFSTENIKLLTSGKLQDACHVMYDNTGITQYQQTFDHDITDEMVREALKSRRSWIVGDEHFKQ